MGAAAATDIDAPQPVVFGLTGGIASGKSFVANLLRRACIPVVDADQVARAVVEPDSIGLEQVVDAFGSEVLQPSGQLDRAKLGNLVFGNEEQLKKLNQILQPLIAEEVAYQIRMHWMLGCRYICYDAALLVELGQADSFRPLIVVSCKPETQLARLLARGLTEDQAKARLASQLPPEDKEAVADLVINTDGTKDETEQQVKELISSLFGD